MAELKFRGYADNGFAMFATDGQWQAMQDTTTELWQAEQDQARCTDLTRHMIAHSFDKKNIVELIAQYEAEEGLKVKDQVVSDAIVRYCAWLAM